MVRLQVVYHPNRCVGNGNCKVFSPANFDLVNQRAILKEGVSRGETVVLERDFESTADIIEAGRKCPANAIGIINLSTGEEMVTTTITQDEARELVAKYDDATEFVLDPKGYFLIRTDPVHQQIEVGFCNFKNKVILKVVGKKPIDIYHTIFAKEKLELRQEHAAYLGRELQKAYIALKKGIPYVQDDELEL